MRGLLSGFVMMLLGLCTGVTALAPQQTAQPPVQSDLIDMMALVPSSVGTLDGPDYFSYVDFRALDAARPDVVSPDNWEVWTSLDSRRFALWFANFSRYAIGSGGLAQNLMQYNLMPDVVGFDFFDIDRYLNFGQPPDWGNLYVGEFDAQSIAEAHTARNYVATTIDEDLTLWCSEQGCDAGYEVNVEEVEPANIFGGDLGREQPFYIGSNLIFNTPNVAYLDTFPNLYAGRAASLLARPAFLAGAEAISAGEGDLIQAWFLNPTLFGADFVIGRIDTTPSETDEQVTYALEGYQSIAPYELAILADRQEGNEQVAIVALVYSDETSAENAAAEVSNRVATFSNILVTRRDEPLIELENINATVADPQVYYSPEADRWVAVISARYDLPPNRLIDQLTGEFLPEDAEATGPSAFIASGLLFRQWVTAIAQRSFTPLVIDVPEE